MKIIKCKPKPAESEELSYEIIPFEGRSGVYLYKRSGALPAFLDMTTEQAEEVNKAIKLCIKRGTRNK